MTEPGKETTQASGPAAEEAAGPKFDMADLWLWRFTVDGTIYDIDLEKLTYGEWAAIERLTDGKARTEWEVMREMGILTPLKDRRPPSPVVQFALVFVAMHKVNPQITEDDVADLTDDRVQLSFPRVDEKVKLVPPEPADQRSETRSEAEPAPTDEIPDPETDEISGSPSTETSSESDPGSSSS